jgi:hypothetical protein
MMRTCRSCQIPALLFSNEQQVPLLETAESAVRKGLQSRDPLRHGGASRHRDPGVSLPLELRRRVVIGRRRSDRRRGIA